MLVFTAIITMIIGFSFMIVSINSNKTELNVEEVDLINLKITLESFALNFVGNKNVTNQTSETFKKKSNLNYRIKNYDKNYIIYVQDPHHEEIVYYMIFNNRKSNNEFEQFTIFRDGYLYGGSNELES